MGDHSASVSSMITFGLLKAGIGALLVQTKYNGSTYDITKAQSK